MVTKVVATVAMVATLVAPSTEAAEHASLPYPNSMAAIGNSMTLAVATVGGIDNSWSTGTNPRVNSQYLRILAANPAIKGHALNLAVGGAGFGTPSQARQAVVKHVGYVTIWGGEDACGTTDVTGFGRDFSAVLATLAKGNPKPLVFVASIIDPGPTYRMLQANRAAVFKASRYGAAICAMTLGTTPASDASPAKITAASQSVKALNDALAAACRAYGSRCRYDGGAVSRIHLGLADMGTDFIHLSISGQRKVAAASWRATFPFRH